MIRSDAAGFTVAGLLANYRAVVCPGAAVVSDASQAVLAAYVAGGGTLITHPESPLLTISGCESLDGDYTGDATWTPTYSLCPPFDYVPTISRTQYEAFLTLLATDLCDKLGQEPIDANCRLLVVCGEATVGVVDGQPCVCLVNPSDSAVSWTNPFGGYLYNITDGGWTAAGSAVSVASGGAVYLADLGAKLGQRIFGEAAAVKPDVVPRGPLEEQVIPRLVEV